MKSVIFQSFFYSTIVFLGLGLSACSTADTKTPDLDQQVQAEPKANTPQEIEQRAADTFSNAPGLTADQKSRLEVIYKRTYAESMKIREEIGKSKSLLFKTVATKDYRSADVEKLRKKIVGLDQQRLEIMFQALADVQGVIGYGKDKEELYKHLQDTEIPRAHMVGND